MLSNRRIDSMAGRADIRHVAAHSCVRIYTKTDELLAADDRNETLQTPVWRAKSNII